MSQVGAFPGMDVFRKRTIRATPSPLDKATIISIYPMEIEEVKHTVQPGIFKIPAGTPQHPAILVVGPSSWWRELDEQQPLLEIPVSSIQIADSIVRDYCNGLFCCDMSEKMPGLFFIPGNLSLETVKKDHKDKLDSAERKQRNWFMDLVRAADVLWSQSNGNPLAISQQMRLAADQLQLKDKPWLADFTIAQLVNCPACGALRNSDFPICQHCKVVIDKVRFEALGLKFAS